MPAFPRFRGLTAVCALAGAALAACSDTTEPGSVFGIYTLEKVDGENLPAVVIDSTINDVALKSVWISGSIQLKPDTTWLVVLTQTRTIGVTQTTSTDTTSGRWERSGNTYTLRDAEATSATIMAETEGDELSLTAVIPELDRSLVALFRK
jgi:hypothetical protein